MLKNIILSLENTWINKTNNQNRTRIFCSHPRLEKFAVTSISVACNEGDVFAHYCAVSKCRLLYWNVSYEIRLQSLCWKSRLLIRNNNESETYHRCLMQRRLWRLRKLSRVAGTIFARPNQNSWNPLSLN